MQSLAFSDVMNRTIANFQCFNSAYNINSTINFLTDCPLLILCFQFKLFPTIHSADTEKKTDTLSNCQQPLVILTLLSICSLCQTQRLCFTSQD